MATGAKNTVSLELWKEGMDQLKKLNCDFLAIYGAEPLEEFSHKLPKVIEYAEKIGIHTTLITSGITKDLNYKLRTLYEHGLRSVTTSYDMSPLDHSSGLKTSKALEVISMFRSFGNVRDVAVVATLTNKNFRLLPTTIREMSRSNIWTFFDLIHPDRHQPGSKVRNTNLDLMFSADDLKELAYVLREVITMKKRGYLCHASEIFMNHIISHQNDIYKWNCSKESSFPAWITVDCDGVVMPCDDFHSWTCTQPFKIWNLEDEWNDFCKFQKEMVSLYCPGCCWNTHIDACAIKSGKLPLTDYIHGTK